MAEEIAGIAWNRDHATEHSMPITRRHFVASGFWDSPSCTTVVYYIGMAASRNVRRSVTLPSQVDKEIEAIAKKRRLSGNRVLLELVEMGLEARKQKEKAFFDLAQRFRESDDPKQVKELGHELGRFIFGE